MDVDGASTSHRPTWALIDIDPGHETTFEDVVLLARLYRTALDHLGVSGGPKVTGQRGIQIWVPVAAALHVRRDARVGRAHLAADRRHRCPSW